MYQGILTTHIIVVNIFLLIYLVKTFLLLTNKNEGLQKFTKITKVPEMIISTLFLITGIYLIINTGNRSFFLYIKLICIAAAIPLAIVGFKKSKKPLAAVSFILLIMAYGLAEMNKKKVSVKEPIEDTNAGRKLSAQELYTVKCSGCHGDKGDAGLSGAADLSISQLSTEEKADIVKNGKGVMNANPELSPKEIQSLVDYIETLKK